MQLALPRGQFVELPREVASPPWPSDVVLDDGGGGVLDPRLPTPKPITT
jgi:hypothetical protein